MCFLLHCVLCWITKRLSVYKNFPFFRDRERFDEGLFRNEACSTKEEYCKQSALDGRIVALQEKVCFGYHTLEEKSLKLIKPDCTLVSTF